MSLAMPKVKAYPVCSQCKAPYVLRHCFVVALKKGQVSGQQWLWQRDCRHKTAPPLVPSSALKKQKEATA